MSKELPESTIANGISFGDYVTSSHHGHTGRAYKFEMLTEDDRDWIELQNIPLTIEDIQQPMIGILNHKGGAVSVPAASCTIIDDIEDFEHPYAEEHFPTPKASEIGLSKDFPKWTKFYIMKAYHLTTSGRKLGLKKICRDEPNCTIVVGKREVGGRMVDCFIIGAQGDYGVKRGDEAEYIVDTGNGYKGGGYLHIEDVLQVRNGAIVKGATEWDNAYTWVMK